jgi:hypothetical protein
MDRIFRHKENVYRIMKTLTLYEKTQLNLSPKNENEDKE